MLAIAPCRYTERFTDFITNNPNWLEENLVMSTTERTTKLVQMLINTYGIYEISGETEGEEKEFLIDVFGCYKDYYEEILDNYTKKFNFESGIINNSLTTHTKKNDGEDSNVNIHVELPNKKIDANDYFNYPDNADKEITTRGTSVTDTNTSSVTSNDKYIKLKNQYIRQIRNIYSEIALKFKECFIMLYD